MRKLWNLKREACWRPTYTTTVSRNGGTQQEPVFLIELKTNECPRSLVSPRSGELVNIIIESQCVGQDGGPTLYGTDSALYDARFFDALVIMREEEQRINHAEDELEAQTR